MSNNRFNIGCGIVGDDNWTHKVTDFYNEFLDDPNVKKLIPEKEYKTIWIGACPIPAQGIVQKSLFDDNLMLIGDTAGFVSPITGEGIYYSIFSAIAAAEVAIEALELENCSKEILKKYKSHSIVKQHNKSFKMHLGARNYFYSDGGKNLNAMFERAEVDAEYREEVIDKFFGK